jgi:hypothetical protein
VLDDIYASVPLVSLLLKDFTDAIPMTRNIVLTSHCQEQDYKMPIWDEEREVDYADS